MLTLKGKHIYLRALELEDLDFIYAIENDETIWEISNTITPFSKYVITEYLANAHKDIFEVKQLRLVISNSKHISFGMIDLFDFDFKNKRAGVGIIVKAAEDRKKGYGSEALTLLTKYCKSQLDLHQLYCNISEENEASLRMFQNQGFEIVGLKKDWNFIHGAFKNEYLLQHILR
jgi:diamine N-acetyltransferase